MKFGDLVNGLEAIGFFEGVAKDRIAEVKQEILASRYLFHEAVARSYFADAEDLAEQGVLDFIGEISPRLALHGVHLPIVAKPRRPIKERDPKTGEVIEVIRYKLQVDDSIPDQPGLKYLRPAQEELSESGGCYRVVIGLRTQEIWNSDPMDQSWEAAMCHALILVNQLLEDTSAAERVYGLYGGNEGHAIFMTPGQFKLISECGDIPETERPWEPYVVK